MAKPKKLESAAFVLLFVATYYALAVLPPHAALCDLSMAESFAGWATVVVALALVVLRLLPKRRLRVERLIYTVFLAGMPLTYVIAASKLGSRSDIALELVGVLVFVGLAVFGYFKSFLALGLGIAAHGLGWDLWHHGPASYIAHWYPSACLVIDVALGFLVITQASAHQEPSNALQPTATPPLS